MLDLDELLNRITKLYEKYSDLEFDSKNDIESRIYDEITSDLKEIKHDLEILSQYTK